MPQATWAPSKKKRRRGLAQFEAGFSMFFCMGFSGSVFCVFIDLCPFRFSSVWISMVRFAVFY